MAVIPNEVKVDCVTASECGLVRKNNEDSVFVDAAKTVFCVADGMGGGSEGARASKVVCEEVAKAVNGGLVERISMMDAAIMTANDRIFRYAKEKGYKQMGSTVAALLFAPEAPHTAAICHVGDSRVYRVRRGAAELLTEDHTIGRQLSAMTTGGQSGEFMSRTNPLAHILTRGIGVDAKVSGEWRKIDIATDDRFLICSDGVHDVVSTSQVGEILTMNADLHKASAKLADLIVANGAPDNYSYVIVNFGKGA